MDDLNYVIGATNLLLDEIVRTIDQLKTDRDNISRDLTTPLTATRMKPEPLLEDGEGGADFFSTSAQQVLSDLERAMTTITALLRISDVESGRCRRNFVSVDLVEICFKVFDLYEPIAEAKRIRMTLDVPMLLVIRGDFDLLTEAVANLVDNALKFALPGAEVTITGKMIDDEPLSKWRTMDRG